MPIEDGQSPGDHRQRHTVEALTVGAQISQRALDEFYAPGPQVTIFMNPEEDHVLGRFRGHVCGVDEDQTTVVHCESAATVHVEYASRGPTGGQCRCVAAQFLGPVER